MADNAIRLDVEIETAKAERGIRRLARTVKKEMSGAAKSAKSSGGDIESSISDLRGRFAAARSNLASLDKSSKSSAATKSGGTGALTIAMGALGAAVAGVTLGWTALNAKMEASENRFRNIAAMTRSAGEALSDLRVRGALGAGADALDVQVEQARRELNRRIAVAEDRRLGTFKETTNIVPSFIFEEWREVFGGDLDDRAKDARELLTALEKQRDAARKIEAQLKLARANTSTASRTLSADRRLEAASSTRSPAILAQLNRIQDAEKALAGLREKGSGALDDEVEAAKVLLDTEKDLLKTELEIEAAKKKAKSRIADDQAIRERAGFDSRAAGVERQLEALRTGADPRALALKAQIDARSSLTFETSRQTAENEKVIEALERELQAVQDIGVERQNQAAAKKARKLIEAENRLNLARGESFASGISSAVSRGLQDADLSAFANSLASVVRESIAGAVADGLVEAAGIKETAAGAFGALRQGLGLSATAAG